MKNSNKKNKRGFTLIETVLYLAIVGILFVAVINFHLILGGSATKLSSNLDTSRNRRMALTKIDYLIRNADGMLKDIDGDCSDFSVPSLELYFDDDTYLPDTCVQNGGAVKIGLKNRRVAMTCYPNITYNGQYDACNAASSTVYYLTTADVVVADNDLRFSSSTDSSSGFTSISTYINTSIIANDQVDLKANSAATSTTVLRNEQPNGLVTWWRFEEGTGTTTVDSAGSNPAGCYTAGAGALPTWTTGIVSSSVYALDFEYDNDPSTCMSYDPATELTTDPDDLNFDDQFTITAWVKPEAFNGSVQHKIISKTQWAYQRGYAMQLISTGEYANCRVFDGTTFADADSPASSIVTGNTYHISCVYDLNNNRWQIYVYESGVGLISTTSYSGTVPILVNDTFEPHISYSGTDGTFDGIIDEVRFYNRALTEDEIFALHTQAP